MVILAVLCFLAPGSAGKGTPLDAVAPCNKMEDLRFSVDLVLGHAFSGVPFLFG